MIKRQQVSSLFRSNEDHYKKFMKDRLRSYGKLSPKQPKISYWKIEYDGYTFLYYLEYYSSEVYQYYRVLQISENKRILYFFERKEIKEDLENHSKMVQIYDMLSKGSSYFYCTNHFFERYLERSSHPLGSIEESIGIFISKNKFSYVLTYNSESGSLVLSIKEGLCLGQINPIQETMGLNTFVSDRLLENSQRSSKKFMDKYYNFDIQGSLKLSEIEKGFTGENKDALFERASRLYNN